ncbi:DUF4197 domain-containing protein [Reichenbachiella ulvae]|uniref:DUF4197 domain-containing protein n=1 Tax=Reichenbachiella ulvae TaxID=2980104 RepID=A0ABT3CR38_9BACT|nr:DUF4197 domain-containing protein [Reichenbachiella ulvae]MCV9386114.1 DUF4197 domain-containing protein [Reichenbachiella ulvae]
MRKGVLLIVGAFLLIASSCEEAEKFFDLPLTDAEIAEGLKAALNEGTDESTTSASAVDGYLKNELIKILLPEEVKNLQSEINTGSIAGVISYQDLLDLYVATNPNIDTDPFEELITAMNRGAEAAAAKAKPIFVDAIVNMSITDALVILQGGETSATEYFIQKTRTQLINGFQPDITSALGQTKAIDIYDGIHGFMNYEYEVDLIVTKQTYAVNDYLQYNLPESIDGYATEKAVDGLFTLIAGEEKKIRANPYSYASDIIQKVFGSDEAQAAL